jgi:hypothetical protein
MKCVGRGVAMLDFHESILAKRFATPVYKRRGKKSRSLLGFDKTGEISKIVFQVHQEYDWKIEIDFEEFD